MPPWRPRIAKRALPQSVETLPSVLSRINEDTSIELIRELKIEGRVKFIGKKLEFKSTLNGSHITLTVHFRSHEMNQNNEIQKKILTLDESIPPGQTVIKKVCDHLFIALSPKLIDATGKAVLPELK